MPKSERKKQEERKLRGKVFKYIAWGFSWVGIMSLLGPFGIFIVFPVAKALGKLAQGFGEGLDVSVNQKKSNKQLIEEEVARQKALEEARERKAQEAIAFEKKNEETKAPIEERFKSTGIKDVDELLTSGWDMYDAITEHKQKIVDGIFLRDVDQLQSKIVKILKEVERDPDDAGKARKFMNYYLPTTLKMIEKYAQIEKSGLYSENVSYAKQKIVDAVGVVNSACDKQLEMLYQNDLLDITTDIQALEQMIQRDGLADSEWDKIQKQNNTQGAN